MNFKSVTIQLKTQQQCTLRTPTPDDAEQIINHIKTTSGETHLMARYPEEITITSTDQANQLAAQLIDPQYLSICAEIDGKIIAHAGIGPIKRHIKYLHRAYFGISIQQQYCHLGIGTILLQYLIQEAPKMGFEQIELEVVSNNTRAKKLYSKMGFKRYGVLYHSFKYKDGSYSDQDLMILKL